MSTHHLTTSSRGLRSPPRPLLGLLLVGAAGCGALFTEAPDERESLDGPIPGLTGTQLASFSRGDEAFSETFSAETGLGPVFNQPSCNSCHLSDGKGHPATNLVRFGRGDPLSAARFDYLRHLGGPQLQDRAVPGYEAETLPSGVTGLSTRSGPVVAGIGLVEAIPEAEILAHADPEDRDGDGIRGVPNYVVPPAYIEPLDGQRPVDGRVLARFGRKATAVTLLQQTVGAYLNDMGLTTDFEPVDVYNPRVGGPSGDTVPDPEVPAPTVRDVVMYLRTLKPPPRRDEDDPTVQQGERVFRSVGCATCHVPSLRTGASPIAALSHRAVPLYSDLLLHDLGPALADNFPEGQATGRQWRTTPLWGLGLVRALLGGTPFYLHDGRTSSLEEAIRLHGGEAQAVRDRFVRLPEPDRQALLRFLDSL